MTPQEYFTRQSPPFIQALMDRYHLRDYQAEGIFGNIGHESEGLTQLRELGQPDGYGGYGWAQWTGPRAHSHDLDRPGFLVWCNRRHMDWKSDAANIGYLFYDLDGEYRGSIAAVLKCKNLYDSCLAFERNFERAGVIDMPSRLKWADCAKAAYDHWLAQSKLDPGVV